MEANNSYCGVGIAFNARIGGKEGIVGRTETVGSRALWVDGKGSDSLSGSKVYLILSLKPFRTDTFQNIPNVSMKLSILVFSWTHSHMFVEKPADGVLIRFNPNVLAALTASLLKGNATAWHIHTVSSA